MENKKPLALTEDQEKEMEELRRSPYVKLAKREQNLIYRKRQYLAQLKSLERRGRELAAQGVTSETLAQYIAELEE